MGKKPPKKVLGKSLNQRFNEKDTFVDPKTLDDEGRKRLKALVAASRRFEDDDKVYRNVAQERLDLLEPRGKPQIVPIRIWNKSEPGKCHRDVLNYVTKNGGSAVQGFRVYENDFQLNGEFHAVWKSPQGELVDISAPWSPRCDGDPTCREMVTFIPTAEEAPGYASLEKGFVVFYDVEEYLRRLKPYLLPVVGDDGWEEWANERREVEGKILTADH